ncbi:hypothetical protein [Massilia oculi]|uniref:hypothetical protein n=1 Tax=Massilia oculi TaxID=945844 RepID=UPI0028AF5169|nr:hypothetical protein [Massilia oculi]
MFAPPSTTFLKSQLCAALLLGILASPSSRACRVPPLEQMVTPEAQIAMAVDVSVAKVVRETPTSIPGGGGRLTVEYEFEVQERIQGLPVQRFIVVGAAGETRPRPSSTDHSDEQFWRRGGGRLYNDSDCVLRPDFEMGEMYLVFRGKPATWRSFEHIETVRGRPNPNDKWLAYVKEQLEGRRQ